MPDFIVASTTATQEQVDHAVSADWRNAIPVKTEEVTVTEDDPETEIPATTEETQEVETAPDSEPEETQEKPKSKGGFQKKIDKLTRERSEEKARADTLERELSEFKSRFDAIEARLAGKPAVTEEKASPANVDDPKPTDAMIGTKYKDWDEKNDALIQWTARQMLAERDQSLQEREAQEYQEARDKKYGKAAEEFSKANPGFNEAVQAAAKAGMKLPQPIFDRIKELPNGPAIALHLVTNLDDALALVEAEPMEGFEMLGRLSYAIEREAEPKPKPPVPKSVSTAPPAVRPVAGNSAKSGASLQDISSSGTEEYVRVRMKQMQEREAARRY